MRPCCTAASACGLPAATRRGSRRWAGRRTLPRLDEEMPAAWDGATEEFPGDDGFVMRVCAFFSSPSWNVFISQLIDHSSGGNGSSSPRLFIRQFSCLLHAFTVFDITGHSPCPGFTVEPRFTSSRFGHAECRLCLRSTRFLGPIARLTVGKQLYTSFFEETF